MIRCLRKTIGRPYEAMDVERERFDGYATGDLRRTLRTQINIRKKLSTGFIMEVPPMSGELG
jgi:hypothetical protein